jgi:hypothetical protein
MHERLPCEVAQAKQTIALVWRLEMEAYRWCNVRSYCDKSSGRCGIIRHMIQAPGDVVFSFNGRGNIQFDKC